MPERNRDVLGRLTDEDRAAVEGEHLPDLPVNEETVDSDHEHRNTSENSILLSRRNSANESEIRVYCRRWYMLFLFVLFSVVNSFQWIQYSIIEDVVKKFYNVGDIAIDATSMIYMGTFIFFSIPAMKFMDTKGLRLSLCIGSTGTAIGAIIKVMSAHSDRFWITMIGQTVVAVSQVFMLNVPPVLAAVWFGSNEVSTACSIGVFGNMLGTAVGFGLPPLMVHDSNNLEKIGNELWMLFVYVALASIFVSSLMYCTFEEKPPTPPSIQQAMNNQMNGYNICSLAKRLFNNRGYMLLMFAFALNQGVFSALSTLLNELILMHFEEGEEFAGLIGWVSVITGMLGGILFGFIQDKTHKYKEMTLSVFLLSLLGLVAFSVTLWTQSKLAVGISAGVLGFFLGGYTPIAYDFGAEMTYPEPDGITSGILTIPTQIFGIIYVIGYGYITRNFSPIEGNLALIISLSIGTILHAFIKPELRRQNAERNPSPISESP